MATPLSGLRLTCLGRESDPGLHGGKRALSKRAIRTALLRGSGIDSQPDVIDSLDSIPEAGVLDEPYSAKHALD
jgi:hypothetical protein